MGGLGLKCVRGLKASVSDVAREIEEGGGGGFGGGGVIFFHPLSCLTQFDLCRRFVFKVSDSFDGSSHIMKETTCMETSEKKNTLNEYKIIEVGTERVQDHRGGFC